MGLFQPGVNGARAEVHDLGYLGDGQFRVIAQDNRHAELRVKVINQANDLVGIFSLYGMLLGCVVSRGLRLKRSTINLCSLSLVRRLRSLPRQLLTTMR
jgi:hypothetical protein